MKFFAHSYISAGETESKYKLTQIFFASLVLANVVQWVLMSIADLFQNIINCLLVYVPMQRNMACKIVRMPFCGQTDSSDLILRPLNP